MNLVPIVLLTLIPPNIPPASPHAGWIDRAISSVTDTYGNSEFGRMLNVILTKGANMGPNDGWFRPSDVRYHWKWLAAKFDADRDGKITARELGGSPDLFMRLDRNRDGMITADDLDWSDSSPFARQMSQASMLLRVNDGDEDRRLSKAEWEAMFKKLAQGKSHLNTEDIRAMLNPAIPPSRPPSPGEMPTKMILLKGLFTGELGSPYPGPELGQPAPDFTLKTPDNRKSVTLSKIIGPKPAVLIFGSFT